MRFLTVACLFVLSIFGAQLVRIQGFDATAVAQEAQLKREAAQIIPAMRGQVLASDGTVLASSVVREVVVADQQAVCTYGTRKNTCDPATSADAVQQAATKLAPLLDTTVSELVARAHRHQPLPHPQPRGLAADLEHHLRARDPGHLPRPPRDPLRAHLPAGQHDGRPGRLHDRGRRARWRRRGDDAEAPRRAPRASRPSSRAATARSSRWAQSSLVPAVDGNDVTLTVNSSLQWYAQNALAQRIKETKAKSGTVVIEDVKTGNLLAVASYPSFDPNTDIGKKGTQLSNVAFSDVFEPGSTSKIMTMAAALEEGTVTPSTPVVIPNRLPRYDANFKDSHEHATEYRTVAGTLAESSNIGTILVSETMKPKTLESYFRKFGLGLALRHRVPR